MKVEILVDNNYRTVDHISSEIKRSLNKQSIATVSVLRRDVEFNVKRFRDEIIIRDDNDDRLFAGVITEDSRKDGLIEYIVESYETYAKDSVPVPPNTQFTNDKDSDIMTELIDGSPNNSSNNLDGVNELSTGNVANLDSEITKGFHNVSPAKCIRKVQEITGGEVKYDPNKNLVYKDNLGENKGTILSPNRKNTSSINVWNRGKDEKATHIRMLGSGSGPNQVTADVVANEYDEDEDEERWITEVDKSISDSRILSKKGRQLIEERYNDIVDVNVVARPPVKVNLGDKFVINYPEEDIYKKEMRAVEVTEIYDSDGERYEATFSTLQKGRRTQSEQINKIVKESNVEQNENRVFGLPTFDNPKESNPSTGAIWVTGKANVNSDGQILGPDFPPEYSRGVYTSSITNVQKVGESIPAGEEPIDILQISEKYTRGSNQALNDLLDLTIINQDLKYGSSYPENFGTEFAEDHSNNYQSGVIFDSSSKQINKDVLPKIDIEDIDSNQLSHGDEITANPNDHHPAPDVEVGAIKSDTSKSKGYIQTIDVGFQPQYVDIHCIYNNESIGTVYSEDEDEFEEFITNGHSHGTGYGQEIEEQVVSMSTVSPGYPGGNKSISGDGAVIYMEEEIEQSPGTYNTNVTSASIHSFTSSGFRLVWTENDVNVTCTYRAFR